MNQINNIKLVSQDEGTLSEADETAIKNNLHMWLSPFVDEINTQDGTVVVQYTNDSKNRLYVDGINNDLEQRILREFPWYVTDNKRFVN